MYKVDRQGGRKPNCLWRGFEREFVKMEEKDIGYEDKIKTMEVSLV